MKHLIISAFAATGFLAATSLLRSHSPSIDGPVGSAGMMSVHDLHGGAAANGLRVEQFEDLSLVFSTATRR